MQGLLPKSLLEVENVSMPTKPKEVVRVHLPLLSNDDYPMLECQRAQ
jgi:hypothetical protein